MTSLLRGDLMSLCDMYLQQEAAFEILSQLGDLGCCQFIDLNTGLQSFQKKYITELCRCAEIERKLVYIADEMEKEKISIVEPMSLPKALQPSEFTNVENKVGKWEFDVAEMVKNQNKIFKNYLRMAEAYYVLTHIGPIMGDVDMDMESIWLKHGSLGNSGRLYVITGVVKRTRCFKFEMMLWRVSRGNIYYRQASEDKVLKDPATGLEIRKVAFLAICQGEQLRARTEKVCTGFRVNTYPCPSSFDDRLKMIADLDYMLFDVEQVLLKTKNMRCKTLYIIAEQWRVYYTKVIKAKAIYHTMSMFMCDVTSRCLIGECWIPDIDLKRVQQTLEYCTDLLETSVPSFITKKDTKLQPPTYYRTNKFTHGFQKLIDAYGYGSYRELNPGLYTIITFPFLFSVMFGDLGHGLLMLIFAVWMVKNEAKFMATKSDNEIWNIFFAGRYIILLMALFSMYAGLMYNECFCKPIKLMPSSWKNTYSKDDLFLSATLEMDPKTATSDVPYLIGADPIWSLAKNKILIENSIKMKMSIIFGVVHMMFGLWLSFYNHRFFKRTYAIYMEFLPQIIFLTLLFAWLAILIFFKWFAYGSKSRGPGKGSDCAPLLLLIFIDMFLMSETKAVQPHCEAYMFENQQYIQIAFMIIALFCIPVMLIGPPIYKNWHNKKMRNLALAKMTKFRKYQHRDSDRAKEEEIMAEIAKYSVPFSELFIHHAIHTIEYVLSTISHTASYLRLWALSLAHSQLSEMLWGMVLSKIGLRKFEIGIGALYLVPIFAVWAAFSLSILVLMEGLSAFLHTLRLHWVEFMSKFFEGSGYGFSPFSFKSLLDEGMKETKKLPCMSNPKWSRWD